jgi:hypothetical protein
MDTKYISLGSVCEVAHILRKGGLRLEGYPFDYITTIDSEGFLEILKDDFKYFMDDTCLLPANKDPYQIFNSYYKLEFLHEGVFNEELYETSIQTLKARYQRRIERFRNLKTYTGPVIFVRHAYKFSLDDPHRVYKCGDNINITEDYANRLYEILKIYFNELNFKLLILNNHTEDTIIEEKRIHDRLIIAKSNIALDIETKSDLYKQFFSQL